MLILFGFSRKPRVLATRPGTCPFCGVSGPQRLIEEAGKFSIFFIPIFTTSRRYYSACPNCGGQNEISRQQKDVLLQGWQAPDCIALLCDAGTHDKQVEHVFSWSGTSCGHFVPQRKDCSRKLADLQLKAAPRAVIEGWSLSLSSKPLALRIKRDQVAEQLTDDMTESLDIKRDRVPIVGAHL